ncbi:MAG: AEC family transporter [Spirochaetaceae bacterium]
MFQPILVTTARLIILMVGGYIVFQPRVLQRHALPFLLSLTVNVLLPVYFITAFSAGWDDAVAAGWRWMPIFFFACVVMMGFQAVVGGWLVRRVPAFSSPHPRAWVALFAVQNVGFIPLPILAAIAPKEINIYMFFFVLAFVIIFWTLVVSLVSAEGGHFVFKPNMPLAGIVAGMIVAVFGLYDFIPAVAQRAMEWLSEPALDLILFVLGGILATIPKADLTYRPEFGSLIWLRMLLYPAALLGILALIPFEGLSAEMAYGIRIMLVLEAAVPPATNLMVAARKYGTEAQVHYMASGMLVTYIASFVTMPLFLIASHAAFG